MLIVLVHFFPYACERGYLAVDFFFILSGYLFVRQFHKYDGKKFWNSLGKFTQNRLKPLGYVFIIGVIFSIWGFMLSDMNIKFGISSNIGDDWPLGVLWYVQDLIPVLIVMFILRRLIKDKTIFMGLIYVCSVGCFVVFLPIVGQCAGSGWGGFLRAFAEVSIGIIISYIPKIKLKWVNIVFLLVIIPILVWQCFLPNSTNGLRDLKVLFVILLILTITANIENFKRIFLQNSRNAGYKVTAE